MKILMLDVDGVLNNRKSQAAAVASPPSHPPGLLGSVFTVDPTCVALLRAFVETHDIKIVLSSSWRWHPHAFTTSMDWVGWSSVPLIGKTPRTAQNPRHGFERGSEIEEWLSFHPEVTQWAIVDDCPEDIHQKDRLVVTESAIGLTDGNIQQLGRILGCESY